MSVYVLALLIGVIAGLRAMTAPAAVSWAAHLGWLPLQGTPLAFLGFTATPYIFTVLAVVELITDQLPETPSRKVPMQFGARIVRCVERRGDQRCARRFGGGLDCRRARRGGRRGGRGARHTGWGEGAQRDGANLRTGCAGGADRRRGGGRGGCLDRRVAARILRPRSDCDAAGP